MNSKKLIAMILLLLLLLAIPVQVFAVEAATAEISFTVKNASGTVVIEAVDNAPLPMQTVFEGASTGKFLISFSEPGDYCYKVYQNAGTEQDVIYDSTVYTVCISVFLDENGELYSVTAVNIENSSQKAEDVEFENTLPTESTEPNVPSEPTEPTEPNSPDTPPHTGDESRLELWTLLMALSFIGIIAATVFYKRSVNDLKREN
ncbi:MAG: hypothetical protein J1F23_00270 [Oscillospiraceae bacterium]|nr:hypothetical protein [Oscillospiraceae bacterium]